MSLADNYAPERKTANGSTTVFTYLWNPIATSYVKVYLENTTTGVQTLQNSSTYTVALLSSGFTVTFNTAPATGNYVVVTREVPLTQDQPYTTTSGFQGAVQESSYDKLTAIAQDINDQAERSLKYRAGSGLAGTIGTPTNNAALIFSGTTGNVIAGPTTTDISNAAANAAAAAASAAAAEAAYEGLYVSDAAASAYTNSLGKVIAASDDVTIAAGADFVFVGGSDRIACTSDVSSVGSAGSSRGQFGGKQSGAVGSTYFDQMSSFNGVMLGSQRSENAAEGSAIIACDGVRIAGVNGLDDSTFTTRYGQTGADLPVFEAAFADNGTATENFFNVAAASTAIDFRDSSVRCFVGASQGTFSSAGGVLKVSDAGAMRGDRNTMLSSTTCDFVSDDIVASAIIASRDSDMGTNAADTITYSMVAASELSEMEDSVSYSATIGCTSSNVVGTSARSGALFSDGTTITDAGNAAMIAEKNSTIASGSTYVACIAGGAGGANAISGSADEAATIATSTSSITAGSRNLIGASIGSTMAASRSTILASNDGDIQSGTNYGAVIACNGVDITAGGDNIFAIGCQTASVDTASIQSGMLGCDNSQITAARAGMLHSTRVINATTNTVVGGYAASGSAATANRKWELNCQTGAINAAGAVTGSVVFTDFAEMFENYEEGEIPAGTIVELVGDKIRPATDSNFLGVISKTAGIILGDSWAHWAGRHITDEFGGLVYETVMDEATGEMVSVPKENPDFEISAENTPRSKRPAEWSVVGLIGQVYVRVASDVVVGDYLSAQDGIGIKRAQSTRLRVMKITTPFNETKGYAVAKCILI